MQKTTRQQHRSPLLWGAWLLVLMMAWGGSGCTNPSEKYALTRPSAPQGSKVLVVPFVSQRPDFCGEACVEMAAAFYGHSVSQKEVHSISGLRGPRGVHADELETTLQRMGWRFHRLPKRLLTSSGAADHAADRALLLAALDRGHPVLLGLWADPEDKQNVATWDFDHFVLLTGYDRATQQFFLHDPLEQAYRPVSWKEFTRLRDNPRGGFYSLELLGLPPKFSKANPPPLATRS